MTDRHIVSAYDDELQHVTRAVTQAGGLAEELVSQSIVALSRLDTEVARSVIDEDKKIDALQREVEAMAISLIARRQPMAADLREVVAAIRIVNDLERVGDLAKNISKRVIAIQDEFHSQKIVHGVEHIAELALAQLKNVLDSYASRDVREADSVWTRDEEIDTLYTSLFRELLTYMMEDPRNITFCTHLLFCAKNIERIGDHATNIAETVHYLVTGEALTEERPKQSSVLPFDLPQADD
jgi:phosphate transport system protein